jgi:ketosteroid isomerase-like protein
MISADTETGMSRENVEIVRRAMAATSRQELDWETVNAVYHPDHVLVPITAGLGDGEVKGAAGAEEWIEKQRSAGEWDSELHGVLDMGPNVVMAEISLHFRGLASGASGEQHMWLVMELKGGKIMQTLAFTRPQEAALEAARLSQ